MARGRDSHLLGIRATRRRASAYPLLFAAALTLLAPAVPAMTPPEIVAADDAFAQLSRLVGTWRPADAPDSALRVIFSLTAGGTVLVESWERRGKPHSLTLYHRDGPALLATHYCPQGNQPRLALAGRDADGLHFTFRDATDLDPATESHQHDLWLDLTEPERLVRSEVDHAKEGPQPRERLSLMRDTGR